MRLTSPQESEKENAAGHLSAEQHAEVGNRAQDPRGFAGARQCEEDQNSSRVGRISWLSLGWRILYATGATYLTSHHGRIIRQVTDRVQRGFQLRQ